MTPLERITDARVAREAARVEFIKADHAYCDALQGARDADLTLREIAAVAGVTWQRVQQLTSPPSTLVRLAQDDKGRFIPRNTTEESA